VHTVSEWIPALTGLNSLPDGIICYRISSVDDLKFEINRLGREDGLIKSTIF